MNSSTSTSSFSASAAASFAHALSHAREEYPMYEDYYGFTEKPFSLTPDPKYLYKSVSHAGAFELLQYAIRRREEIKRGRLAGVSKQELIDTLNEFLLSLLPLRASAVLILDEAQNLPKQVL